MKTLLQRKKYENGFVHKLFARAKEIFEVNEVCMTFKKASLVLATALLSFPMFSWGATTATATVTYTIGTITAISVSGNPAALTINSAVAGSAPTSATDATTTYAVTTNTTAQRVTAAVASAMPSGVTLSVNLAAPSGATSAGNVALTTTSQALVTGLSNVASASNTITYTLAATVNAASVANATNTVTYTIGP